MAQKEKMSQEIGVEPDLEPYSAHRVGRIRRILGKLGSIFAKPTPEEFPGQTQALRVLNKAWKSGWRPSTYIDYANIPLPELPPEFDGVFPPQPQRWENYPKDPSVTPVSDKD